MPSRHRPILNGGRPRRVWIVFAFPAAILAAWCGVMAPLAAEQVTSEATAALEAEDPAADSHPYEHSLRAALSADLIDLSGLRAALEQSQDAPLLRMTLAEAIHAALQNNPDIIIAGFDPNKAQADEFTARGEFDPVLRQNLTFADSALSLDQRVRRFARFSSVASTSYTSETALGGKLKSGARYAVQFDVNYEESTFDSFAGEYGGQLGLTLTQPLLRGFGRAVNTVRIRGARNLRAISEAQLRLTMLRTLGNVVKAYWDLAGAVEAVRMYEEALRNAERLLRINETRREIGAGADIDVLQAKAGVALRQTELITARARARDLADLLKLALHLQEDGRFSKAMIVPVDRPGADTSAVFDTTTYDANLELGVRNALELRPEMQMTQLEIENAELDEQRARNEMLPQLDVVGSYTRGGRSPGLGRTLSGILEEQDRSYGIGIQGSIAINNRAARGARQRARVNVRQSEERRKQAEMAITMNVHHAARNVMTNHALVESNRQIVRLQEANVAAEEKRLRLGVTTSYQVLRVQEDLTAAQVQGLQARIAFEKALVDFQAADGTLLRALGVQCEPVTHVEPVSYGASTGFHRE